MPVKSAAAYAERRFAGRRDRRGRAAGAGRSGPAATYPGEDEDVAHAAGLGAARAVRVAGHGARPEEIGRRADPVRRARGRSVVPVAGTRTASGAIAVDDGSPFDICGPLPSGTTVLEASAGTGKTHAIGALVTRYVAEGVATLDELLVITFGRAASQELRERVRGQLVRPNGRSPIRPRPGPGTTRATRCWPPAPDDEVATRRERLRAALAGFDAATIVTTHQFCQYVLTGLGIAGDGDADVELVESLDDLVVEVVDDLYVGAFAGPAGRADFRPGDRIVVGAQGDRRPAGHAGARRRGPGTSRRPGGWPSAGRVRAEVDRRKRRRRMLGYDDLLSRLATALEPEDAPARDRMRARWRIVLVDEFQDTDPVQWQILRARVRRSRHDGAGR